MFRRRQRERKLDVFFPAKKAQDVCRTIARPPPPKNIEQNILGYVDLLKFCSLFLLIAQFNNNKRPPHNTSTTHNNNQNEAAFALPSAALPSHSMGMSAAPPTHGAAAPYGPMQGARDRVWLRHGQFSCWGGKMKTQRKI